VTFTRWTAFGAATTPLVEGEVPASESLATSTVTITPERYGSYVYMSDKLVQMGIFNMLRDAGELLGEQAALTSDTLARACLIAGTTIQYADGQSANGNITAAMILDAEELIKGRQTLVKNKARPVPEAGGRFALIFHPDQGYDLRNDPKLTNAWQHAAARGDDNPLFGHAVADYMGIRFYESQNVYTLADGGSSTTDLYYAIMLGERAYGIAGYGAMMADYIEGGTGETHRPTELIYHPFGDYPPMDNKMSLAWVFSQQEAILNNSFMVVIRTASSIGSN